MITKILGIDPGVTTGYALIELHENPRSIIPTTIFGNTKDMTLVDIKDIIESADYIVYEGWRTFKKHAQTGRLNFQTVPAEQVIGSLKTLLRLQKKTVEVQENLSGLKPVGYGYANMKYTPGKKGMHWQDALAHAVYFAVNKLKWPPVGVDPS